MDRGRMMACHPMSVVTRTAGGQQAIDSETTCVVLSWQLLRGTARGVDSYVCKMKL